MLDVKIVRENAPKLKNRSGRETMTSPYLTGF